MTKQEYDESIAVYKQFQKDCAIIFNKYYDTLNSCNLIKRNSNVDPNYLHIVYDYIYDRSKVYDRMPVDILWNFDEWLREYEAQQELNRSQKLVEEEKEYLRLKKKFEKQ